MKTQTVLVLLLSVTCFEIASAKTVVIDKNTPVIVPAEQVYQFKEIDWDKVEARQNAGKSSGESVVMMCDDTYYQVVQIKLPEGLENVTVDSDDCQLSGASTGEMSPAWLQFDGPEGSCNIKVQKKREGGQSPLVVDYEISDAC